MKKQLVYILAIAVLLLAGCDTTSTTTLLNGDFLPADTSLPNILSPEEGDTVLNLTADLRWTAKEGAEYYSIEVATDAAFTQQITGSPFRVGAPNTFYKLTLPSAGTYYWRIRASVTASGQYASSYFDAKEDCLYVYFPYDPADPDAKPYDTDKTGNLDSPYQTINRALAEAYKLGISTVKVASRGEISAGNFAAYEEYFIFRDGVSVLGGYNADFSERHDFSTGLENNEYVTRLEGIYYQAIEIKYVFLETLIEGFTISSEGNYGIYINTCGSELFIANSIIQSKPSLFSSVGIYINSSTSTIIDNIIKSDETASNSAGLHIQYGNPAIINNLIIAKTITSAEHAAMSVGVRNYGGDPILVNNTIVGGVSASNSYGMYNELSAAPVAINNIFTTIDSDSGYGVYGSGAGDINYHYNCICGNGGTDYTGITLGTGNVMADPSLDSDYSLTASSPSTVTGGGVIDPFTRAGITPLDEYLLDIAGVTRTPAYVADSTLTGWSMGAYEY